MAANVTFGEGMMPTANAGGNGADSADGSGVLPPIPKAEGTHKRYSALPPPSPPSLALKPPAALDHELLRGGVGSDTAKTPMSLTRHAGFAFGGDVGPVSTPTTSSRGGESERRDLDQQSRGGAVEKRA